MKSKVSLRLQRLSASELLSFSLRVIQKMTGNTNFVTPIPSLANMELETTAFEKAMNLASQGGKQFTAEMNDQRRKLELMLTQLGHYVEDTAQGTEAIILSSGMDAKRNPIISGIPEAPQNLTISKTTIVGQFKLIWDKVVGSRIYILEKKNSEAPQAEWEQVEIIPKARTIISNETIGSVNLYRVSAFGTNRRGPSSDPVHVPNW